VIFITVNKRKIDSNFS